MDRRLHLDLDLCWYWKTRWKVEDANAERRAERDRQHLDAKQPVDAEEPRGPLAPGQKESGLLPTDRYHRDDRHLLLERQPDESFAVGELDLIRMPTRPECLVVAARIDQGRGALAKRPFR